MGSISVDDFYGYETLTEKLEDLTDAAPDLVSMSSIGESREGRDIWCLTVANAEAGPAIDRRPAMLVTANLHATELAGSWVALHFLSHLVDSYPDDEDVRRLLDERAFYVIPRIAVDGAEDALNLRGNVVRSRYIERDPDEVYEPNTLVPRDLDGDGRILTMRFPDEYGDQVALEGDDRAMVSYDPDDDDGERRRYRTVTEGVVANDDGGEVTDPHYAQVRSDFNRNFPSRGWQPFDWQGHGKYPLSEPETRAVGEFVYDHPNVAGLVDLHTGNPAIFYPRALAGSDPEHPADANLLEEIGTRGEELTGFPYIWGYGELRGAEDPDQHLPGSFKDFAYDRLGIPAVIAELGLFYNYLGFDGEDILSGNVDEEERVRRLLEYQDEHPDRELFHEWDSYDHPQLGEVEIGGLDKTTHGNPPAEAMPDVAASVTEFVLAFAEYRPDVEIDDFDAERLDGDCYRVSATIVNRGKLSTSLTERGRETDTHVPDRPRVDLESERPLEFVSGTARRKLDHLEADEGRTSIEWIVRAPEGGTADLSIESVRGVFATASLEFDRGG